MRPVAVREVAMRPVAVWKGAAECGAGEPVNHSSVSTV